MVLEELILLYYLRIFSLSFLIIVIYFCYLFLIKEIELKSSNITIERNQSLQSIIEVNVLNLNYLEKNIIKKYMSIHSRFISRIHYGKFIFPEKVNLVNLILKITKPSNYILKLTIVEGWNKEDLNKLLDANFNEYQAIDYQDILADTFFLHSYEKFDDFYRKLKIIKKEMKNSHADHELLKKFTFEDLLVIGSLLEKEGKDNFEKKVIFSVIQNRLEKNMKLQIDATTIFAITNGTFNMKRKLNLQDLKVEHLYNTYYIKGLPPGPISYVGKKTMELIFENYKSNYLYYFYNTILKKHVYSETFDDHKRKLNEYRNKK